MKKNIFLSMCLILLSPKQISAKETTYKSQYGQDRYFNENYFHDKKEGFFLDIGAHDGVSGSNTWFYEKELGWNGVCVEPMLNVFKKLTNERDCICIEGAIAPEEGKVLFRRIEGTPEMLSGIESKFDPRHIKRMEREVRRHKKTSYEFIEVECYNVNTVLEKNNIHHVDFLSLDTEGGELDILK